ncbi:hypothetical protein TPR58_18445 [Sphingomonas sp. HF-S3]|uniref:SLC13 family permease n=1 Tax=Sphingomonas rustica TaxID=3103142 RepID=A0ABV0BD52_9SPHN
MPTTIRVRTLQALFGLAYTALALIAIGKSPGFATTLSAIVLACLAYMSSRTVPDRLVTLEEAVKLSPVALAVIAFGVVADSLTSLHAVGWAATVMSYCAGNRMRAAGVGPLV